MLDIFLGIIMPLVGTTLGAMMVFFMKGEMKPNLQKLLLGFASGVMIAASVWSLIMPSIEMSEANGGITWIPPLVGFLCGVGFLLLLDTLIPHLHVESDVPEGKSSSLNKSFMLVLAVILHNIPEGMAVGVALAGVINDSLIMSMTGAFTLALGIAIQNFPEGAIVAMPLVGTGLSKIKAFKYGFVSGVVEPIAAMVTIFIASSITPLLPYLLSFAAGSMIYVVVEELIPAAHTGEHSNIGTIGAALGFALMMLLDIALK